MESTTKHFLKNTLVFAAALAVTACYSWSWGGRGLWIDETESFWITHDGLFSLFHRLMSYHPQNPPLFFFFEYLLRPLLGDGNRAFRLLSTISVAVTAWTVSRLLQSHRVSWPGPFAAAVLLADPIVIDATVQARPMALELALSSLALLALRSFLDSPNRWSGIRYALVTALAVWARFSAVELFPLHLLFVWNTRGQNTFRSVIPFWGFAALLCLPLVPQFSALIHHAPSLRWLPQPGTGELMLSFVSRRFLVPLVLAMIVLFESLLRGRRPEPELHSSLAYLGIGAALLPPVVAWAYSNGTENSIFYPRYFSSFVLGVSLTSGYVFSLLSDAESRLLAAALYFGSLWMWPPALLPETSYVEDWRGVSAQIQENNQGAGTVLFHSALIESGSQALVEDPEWGPYLTAPFTYAPIPGGVAVFPLPYTAEEAWSRARIHSLVDSSPARNRVFVVLRIGEFRIGAFLSEELTRANRPLLEERSFGTVILRTYGAVESGPAEQAPPEATRAGG